MPRAPSPVEAFQSTLDTYNQQRGTDFALSSVQEAGSLAYAQAARTPRPQHTQPRRRSWLKWAVPAALVALVALVLGLTLGPRDGDDGDGGTSASERTTTTEKGSGWSSPGGTGSWLLKK